MRFILALWLAFIVFAPTVYDRAMLWQADTTTVMLFNLTGGSLGSGVILGKHDAGNDCVLLVATARHVVDEKDPTVALEDMEGVIARVVVLADNADTAALEFVVPGKCSDSEYRAASLSKHNAVHGDKVFGSGFPGGMRYIGWGLVLAQNVEISVDKTLYKFTSINYAAGPGHSGGPMFDGYGQVVGLLSATSQAAQTLSMMTSVDQIRSATNKIQGWDI